MKLKTIFAFIVIIAGSLNVSFGQTWTLLTNAIPPMMLRCSADGMKLIAACGDFGGLFSTNAGITWSNYSTSLANATAAASSADGTILYMCSEGLQTSTTSGLTWNPVSNSPWYGGSRILRFIQCSADGTKLLAASNVTPSPLYTSPDSGATWNSNTVPINNWVAGAVSADGATLIAIGNNGPVYLSKNSGATWVLIPLPTLYYSSVATSADGTKDVVVASSGQIFTSTNSGATWKTNSTYTFPWYAAASSADGNRLVVVANSGPIYSSTNSGTNWVLNNAPTATWGTVASSADGCRQFAGGHPPNARAYTAATNPPHVRLNATSPNGNVKISWPVISTNVALQQCSDLTTTNWVTLSNLPTVNPTNLHHEIFLTPTNNLGFYRLVTQ